MQRAAGPILRWVGLLIELASILALVRWDYQGRTIGGLEAQYLLLAGVALGVVLWAIGVALILRAARQSRSS
jgi:hypothetical protein